MLSARSISKRFDGVTALSSVDFSVNRGEVVALIGENGAGKSTLMKIIGGVFPPDDGTIEFDGRPYVAATPASALRQGVRVIYQELSSLENLTVAANVFLGFEKTRRGLLDEAAMVAETAEILQRLRSTISPRAMVGDLSLADRQIVEIARALTLDVKVLILDEPTSSLTGEETKNLFRLIEELKQEGVGIVYISHRLDEIAPIADRVVAFRDGKNSGSLSKSEITHDAMIQLMVGRELVVERQGTRAAGETRLALKGVRTRRYPNQSVDLSVGRGEILGMFGLVGSGRTELAQAVFGIEPHWGEIWLDGNRTRIANPQEAVRLGIFLVPEDRKRCGLTLDSSIQENVAYPALNRFSRAGVVSERQERTYAESGMQTLGIKAQNAATLVRNLSGGNQQKVVLSRWMQLGPSVLIVDEPTRGVDVGSKADIYAELRQLAESGVAVWMISSDMEEILRLSDRVAVMHEGRLSGILALDEATEQSIMRLATGGHE